MAAAHPSPFKRLALFGLVLWCLAGVRADPVRLDSTAPAGQLARIEAHTAEELSSILARAEALLDDRAPYTSESPIALILHGEEASAFLRDNYGMYRELVNSAARLDAFNVIDVQICETWMRDNGVERDELPPFVRTVPYGPDAEQRLLDEGYEHF